MTSAGDPASVLPSLALLSHRVRVLPMDAASLVKMPENTILFLDARDDLANAKTLCRLVQATGLSTPIVLVLTEGGFTVVNSQWGVADVVVASASPAEVEGRLRLVSEHVGQVATRSFGGEETGTQVEDGQIRSGDLMVDTNGYTASLRGHPIDLAYKEFELLKYLVQHPNRVFTRAQLLQEVWGYDYYGGTRTVDVHIRRLRAKLGGEYEHLIGTVRNVGYRFDPPEGDKPAVVEAVEAAQAAMADAPGEPTQSTRTHSDRDMHDSVDADAADREGSGAPHGASPEPSFDTSSDSQQ
ncbi:winged helix-turn-helix transcriptional regulator [Bifidobacterium sp.]|uniref:winged helix-turn-helix transcriptional regulator n=1 Tax=Bifidobacterium sp. TaxID=41200 RepID=UPI0025C1FB39|nr:response regulator transcription factor [Bifidobacterium sp.]MCH4209763.1 response regulator transcription factor [Bifidobacterium sp.]MCI1224925.1 response regulator transcription factor [Bifidobacterium sp.]